MVSFDPVCEGGTSYTAYKYNEEKDTATFLDHGMIKMKKPWISGYWKNLIGEVLYFLAGALVLYFVLTFIKIYK
jgi:hypothetical protein